MATVTRRRSTDPLVVEQAAAWFEYLEATCRQGLRYEEVEPWAWKRLQARLKAIDARSRARR